MKRFVLFSLILAQFSNLVVVQAMNFGESGQDQARPHRTRPRRAETPPEVPPPSTPRIDAVNSPRPFIRVALAVDVPSAVISCDQEIVRIDEASQQVVRLAETEIRVESVLFDDSPTAYSVQVAAVRDRRQADGLLQQLRSEYQEEATLKPDGEHRRQLIYLGRFSSEGDAGGLAIRLRSAGFRDAKPVLAPPKPVLVARSPNNESLLRVPSRLTFAPLEASQVFIKFGGRAYRGHIVVQLNSRERLNVVNELSLEEYLWSVVPNELGPTAFGELEALKAQTVAARTYAVRQKLQSANAEGYDLLADIRSQVYTGVDAEHPLSTRAVDETRGMIVTYKGEPIEALYSSTCGGRTEDSETVFTEMRPYLRGVFCAPEIHQLVTKAIVSPRPAVPEWPVAWLQVYGVNLPQDWTPDALQLSGTADEIHAWIARMAARLGRSELALTGDKRELTQLDGLARILVDVFYPKDYLATLLTPADVEYILDYDADGETRLLKDRAALALLIRDGILSPWGENRMNPETGLSRAEVLMALARLLQRAGAIQFQAGTVRQLNQKQLVIEPEKGEARTYVLADAPFLFKLINGDRIPIKRAIVIGGEKVRFHLDAAGRIDYLEVQPHPGGATYDRYSFVSRWETRLKPEEVAGRLRSRGLDVGDVVDLKVAQRGGSQRATSLEILGTNATKELQGAAIRSTLGLRENLFVIDRMYDENGRVAEFIFVGRGWGHGVGLCQVGAFGLARQGFRFTEILRTYYTGVEFTNIY